MKTRTAFIILALVSSLAVSAQNKPYMQDLPYYVENLNMFGEGQEEG